MRTAVLGSTSPDRLRFFSCISAASCSRSMTRKRPLFTSSVTKTSCAASAPPWYHHWLSALFLNSSTAMRGLFAAAACKLATAPTSSAHDTTATRLFRTFASSLGVPQIVPRRPPIAGTRDLCRQSLGSADDRPAERPAGWRPAAAGNPTRPRRLRRRPPVALPPPRARRPSAPCRPAARRAPARQRLARARRRSLGRSDERPSSHLPRPAAPASARSLGARHRSIPPLGSLHRPPRHRARPRTLRRSDRDRRLARAARPP